MPDSSLLPPGSPAAPLPPAVGQPASPAVESTDSSLASLSPFVVLQSGAASAPGPSAPPVAPAAPPVPVPAPALPLPPSTPLPAGGTVPLTQSTAPSRDALIKEAGRKPDSTFLLPDIAPSDAIQGMAIEGKRRPDPRYPSREELLAMPAPKRRQLAEVMVKEGVDIREYHLEDLKEEEIRQMELAAAGAAEMKRVQADQAKKENGSEGVKGSRPAHHLPGVVSALFALLVLVGIAGGVSYVLASMGWRIPFLYKQVSGLEPKGSELAKQVQAALLTGKTYQLQGNIQVNLSSEVPSTSSATGASTTLLTGMKNEFQSHWVDLSRAVGMGKSQVQVSVAAVPRPYSFNLAYLYPQGESPSPLLFTVPAELADPPVTTKDPVAYSLPSASLRPTAVYSLFYLPSVPDLLGAVKSEAGYRKEEGDHTSAWYQFDLDENKAAAWLPTASSGQKASLEMTVPWKQAAAYPSRLILTVNFTLDGKSYQWKADLIPSNIGQPLTASVTAQDRQLQQWLTAVTLPTAPETKLERLSFLLGLASPQSLPGYRLSSSPPSSNQVSPAPTSSPSASPTATPTPTPTPTPQPTPTAIQPTGEGITSLGQAVPVPAPVPTAHPDAAALQRDQQRKHDLADLAAALESYRSQHGQYPVVNSPTQTVVSATLLEALVPRYLTKLPVDPLKSTYWYEYSSNGTSYHLSSVAENGQDPEARRGSVFAYFLRSNP